MNVSGINFFHTDYILIFRTKETEHRLTPIVLIFIDSMQFPHSAFFYFSKQKYEIVFILNDMHQISLGSIQHLFIFEFPLFIQDWIKVVFN